ncbi:MAG TPA: hypothetical protein DCZ76_08570 [Treponema sp.]|nr:hypothetical protein [Treponema sp.]
MEDITCELESPKEPMDGRLSSMQNCEAVLQSFRKSTEGFSEGLVPPKKFKNPLNLKKNMA